MMSGFATPVETAGAPSVAALRRGACPTLASPMQTGDGLLARLRPVAAGYSPAQWAVLAALAKRHGNGLLDVTARGNLQVRGLDALSAQRLAEALDDARLLSRTGLVVETPPLAGLDPAEIADATDLAERIRDAVRERGAALTLAPKLSVVVNGGGRISLADMNGDLRLDAVSMSGEVFWRVALAGDAWSARPVAILPEADVPEKVIALLEIFSSSGPATRGRNIGEDVVPTVPAPFEAAAFDRPADPVGWHEIAGLGVLGLRLPYGRAGASDLASLMHGLAELGADEIRLSPHRALLVLGLDPASAEIAARQAAALHFLTDADDPANFISACPGKSGCASAGMDTHAVARMLIDGAPSLLDGASEVHVSGCAKGCAHPAAAGLTMASVDGRMALVFSGKAGDVADLVCEPQDLPLVIAAIEAHCREHRRDGEDIGNVLKRMDPLGSKAFAKA